MPHSREAGAVQPLSVRAVDWNPAHTAIAAPRAIADNGDAVAVFGDKAAWTFRSGALSSHVEGASWREAAAISGADGSSRWIVGIDAKGELQHLRGAGSTEDVTARYGLPPGQVKGAAMVDAQRVAFLLNGNVAVADGERVTRYAADADGSFSAIAGGGGYVGAVGKDEIAWVHVTDSSVRHFALEDAAFVAVAPDGHLYAATRRAIYGAAPADDHLSLLYVASGKDLHGIAASGDRLWFGDGTELGSLGVRGSSGVTETSGAKIDPAARLFGSTSGDVWVVESAAVKRFAAVDSGVAGSAASSGAPSSGSASAENVTWTGKLLPVFARDCAACHQSDGVSGVDLSSYSAWENRREDILDEVITKRAMPPSGHTISDADRAAIQAWATSK